MSTTTETTPPVPRIAEIRAELDAIAPVPEDGEITAGQLARCFAVLAQEHYTGALLPGGTDQMAMLAAAEYAAADALFSLETATPGGTGDAFTGRAAERIRNLIAGDGDRMGEFLAAYLGEETSRKVNDLMEQLAAAMKEAEAPRDDRQHPMHGLLGEYLTVTNPDNGSSWTGRLIAYHDDPGAVIETADGTHMCLPQAFTITRADEPEAVAEPEPELPPGRYGRIELPGYRNHTGWIAEETRFGQVAAVVRDWDGLVVAEVFPGPACRVQYLPTPLKRPAPAPEQLALTAGSQWGSDDDDYDDERHPF